MTAICTGELWAVAERLGWGRTYDAEYVAVALDANLPLLTLDLRLDAAWRTSSEPSHRAISGCRDRTLTG